MNFTDTRFFRFVATAMAFVTFNLAAPQGVMTLMAPDPNAPKPAPPIEKTPKRTRLLSAKVMRTSQGRIVGNPYLAGQNKWDVTYKGVNMMTGAYSLTATDISYEGGYGIPVNVTRSYTSGSADEGPLGYGWNLSVDVRSTAGGLLKSSGAPVRSIPTQFKERPTADNDPRILDANEPVAAIIATDAGGQEETIQKDVDGILTTPPWDKNVIDTEYEFVTVGSSVYQVVKKNTVKTLDGTVYHYSKHGSYPTGLSPRGGGATGEPSNVLKIDKAIDRHGNETLYTYATASPVTFAKANGTVTEERLVDIKMPNGHHIGFEWTGNRITKAKDLSHSGTTVLREWTYGYTSGRLTSATSPGGKVTTYGYGSASVGFDSFDGSVWNDLLTSITDPRGLTTTIEYVMGKAHAWPNGALTTTAAAFRVTQPNGVKLFTVLATARPDATAVPYVSYVGYSFGDQTYFQEHTGTLSQPPINMGVIWATTYASGTVPIMNVAVSDSMDDLDPVSGYRTSEHWNKEYHLFTQDLLRERKLIRAANEDPVFGSLHAQRRATPPSWALQRVETTKEYNFMGNPLEQSVVESSKTFFGGWTSTPAKSVSYAYWGADKYFQQRAVRSKKDASSYRYSFTDYYDANAAQGMKGQTKAVYDAKHATYSLGLNWKYDIQPASGSHPSADFPIAAGSDPGAYDLKGRVVRVRKLAKVISGAPTFAETRTDYGTDTDGSWGKASSVTEAYGTPIARTTYSLAYTPDGKASQIQDANGRVLQTDFAPDGEVNWVKRIDSGLNQLLSSYTYGTTGPLNGQITAVSDGLSGVTQNISYVVSGGGIGRVGQIIHSGGGLPNYITTYVYNSAGERAEANYDTPNGVTTWSYGDYIRIGDPTSGSRVFQTLRRLNAATSAGTSEEFHYAYDSAGRLANSMFGQTPQAGSGAPTSAPYYTQSYPASKRYQACYEMDPSGRTLGVYHRWDQWSGSAYTGTPVLANECQYDVVKGLKTQSRTLIPNGSGSSWTVDVTETYGYEAERDFLTSADYDGSGPLSPQIWSFDAAQNRDNSGYTYDVLNRVTASPGYTYTHDAVGNRLSKGGVAWSYTWDALNRLVSHSQSGQSPATYTYRADGMRVGKAIGTNSNNYRFDGRLMMQEVESIGGNLSVVTDFALGGRGTDAISRTTSGTTTIRYPLYDAHGNMVGTVASSGPASLADRRSYDVWGGVRLGMGTGAPNIRFSATLGHQQDDESGLIYMGARYHDPSLGRFLSEDPEMDGWNWYTYCGNDPINFLDRTGEARVSDQMVAICLAVGFVCATAAYLLVVASQRGGIDPEDRAMLITVACAAGAAAIAAFGMALYIESTGLRSTTFKSVVSNYMLSVFSLGLLANTAVGAVAGLTMSEYLAQVSAALVGALEGE